MILTLEDLFGIIDPVADVVSEKGFLLAKNNEGWFASFGHYGNPIYPDHNNLQAHKTAKEAIIAALKAVKPKG